MQPPEGLREKVAGLMKLKEIAGSRPKTVRSGPCQEVVLTGDDVNLDLLPIQTCWPGDAAPFITLPAVITKDPQHRRPQRRHVPDAEDRPALDLHALADPQGRTHGLPGDRRPARGRGRARARPGDGVLRERAAPQARRRADDGGLPARRRGRARPGEDGRPRGARARRDRARGVRREGRRRQRGAVRRPHRLLHGAGAVPGLPPHRDDDAARRDLPVDRRRQAAGRGRLARQGDRADLPAGDPDVASPRSSTTTCRSPAPSTTARSSRSGRPSPARRRRSCTRSGGSASSA